MTPTIKGQYRRVRYTDDGCHLYQCLWCHQSVEVRDDPQYGWNFCPLCGKSWFRRLECRDHDTPAWAWNRYGTEGMEHPDYYRYKKDEYMILIEWRTKWQDRDWGEWQYETSHRIKFGRLGVWRDMQYYLAHCRARAADDPDDEATDGFGAGIKFEYRALLEKLNPRG